MATRFPNGIDTSKITLNNNINVQTGTSYTLTISDNGKIIESNNVSSVTITVPQLSSVKLPIGTQIGIVQYGAGQVTLAEDTSVTIRSAGGLLSTRVQYSCATLYKRDDNEWVLSGDLA